MAQEKTQEASVQPTPARTETTQQPRPCPQDCRMCGINQQVFCTTKMLFDLSRSQQVLHDQIKELSDAVGILREQMPKKEDDGQLSIPFAK